MREEIICFIIAMFILFIGLPLSAFIVSKLFKNYLNKPENTDTLYGWMDWMWH
jgi:uncharacterized protein YneF (UPF0154 family)